MKVEKTGQIVRDVLARCGLIYCPECLSWIYRTGAAHTFHQNRCSAMYRTYEPATEVEGK